MNVAADARFGLIDPHQRSVTEKDLANMGIKRRKSFLNNSQQPIYRNENTAISIGGLLKNVKYLQ